MKILIIGASSYVGARLYFDLRNSFEVIGTYYRSKLSSDFIKLNITNAEEVEEIFEKINPDIVIHTANHASPRPAAEDPEGYESLNLDSTSHIVKAANNIGAKVFFISSFTATESLDNIYGLLKAKSEELVKNTKAGYFILRPSLILGFSPNTTNDRPFNRVLKCIDENKVGEFDTSWKFYPTYLGQISEVIVSAIEKSILNRTIHIFSSSLQTQFSTATDILKPFGVKVKPMDKGLNLSVSKVKEKELIDLGLPTCSYQEMIDKIHEEIKVRHNFNL